MENNIILHELLNKQLPNVDKNKKLTFPDLKRINKYINTSIFDENKCCLWNGYITNSNKGNGDKAIYINFYFKNRKRALHRLLYENYVGHIENNDYLKFTCENKGRCCNVKHISKFEKKNKKKKNKEIKKDIKKENNTGITISSNIVVEFF